ncbi:hypothetical protein ACIA5D_01170 [Actinoplanes sp. NPDC051513]|uniref:hypothetical protein n=1 Tax=Actinoplanes sp. NPDC051513 TaxID=3363908 RepID=UPI0037947221
MTEDSRNHVRGYGSFPEGSEPTEQIAARIAGGDPLADQPASPSSAHPSIPIPHLTPSAARPSNPWSAPPRDPHAPPEWDEPLDIAPAPHPVNTYSMSAGSAERPAMRSRPDSPPGRVDSLTEHPEQMTHLSAAGGPYFAPSSPAPAEPGGPWAADPAEDAAPPAPADDAPPAAAPTAAPTALQPAHPAAPQAAHPAAPQAAHPAPETPDPYDDLDAWDPLPIRSAPVSPASDAPYDPWDPYAPPLTEDRSASSALYPALSDSGLYTPAVNKAPSADPYGLPVTPMPRIEPTPPPPRPTRLLAGLLIGLLAGLLLFGVTGVLVGRTTAPQPEPPRAPEPTPSLFEQTQASLNRPKFANSSLLPLAQGWLPYLSTCARSTPNAGDGESVRIRCTASGMSAFFVQYKTTADRDKARADLKKQAEDARTLAPGVTQTAPKTSGNYVEYAYRLTEGGVTRTVAGMWWEDPQAPTAAYLLAYWKDGLGERWEPMRDLWSRYA